MSSSTPLDALSNGQSAGGAPPADEERVRRILAEMNADGDHRVIAETQRVITEPPITMSTGQLRMDAGTARANIIGNSTPTMADFQAMLQQASPGMAPLAQRPSVEEVYVPKAAKDTTSWKTTVFNYLRGPVAVATIVFLLNLPVVTAILSRYASWMYLSSGEISVGGLLVKAMLAAVLFSAYQGITLVMDK